MPGPCRGPHMPGPHLPAPPAGLILPAGPSPETTSTTLRIALRWMEQTCTVDAPADIAVDVGALFPRMLATVPPGAEPDVRVVSGPSGFTVSGDVVFSCDSAASALWAVELALTRRLLALDTRHCHVHGAAATTPDGRAMLAMGPSGSGKSTLAFAWCRLGRPVLGDDAVAIDEAGLVYPFPRPLKVDAQRLREAGGSPEHTLGWETGSSEAWVDPDRYAGWAGGGARVGLLAEIRFVPGSPVRAEEVAGAARLRMLLSSAYETGVPKVGCVDRFAEVAEGCVAYQLEFGDAMEAAAHLLALAEGRG